MRHANPCETRARLASEGAYPGDVIGTVDIEIRRAVFAWLADHREVHGETVSWQDLVNFEFRGQQIRLVGATGIWKPAQCELPISIMTSINGPYSDAFDNDTGRLSYAYRGTDPDHRDNVGLRRVMRERVPLVYFVAMEKGVYVPQYPVFIVDDDPKRLTFGVQVDDITAALAAAGDSVAISDAVDGRRAYVTRTVRQRVHQVVFRERVIRAYQQRCALCLLRHEELLDAAHITPDSDADGIPVVTNGIALCKLHHAAFDRLFFAIRSDYEVEVRKSILSEVDGPMLTVGLQQTHGKSIYLPKRVGDRPDARRLEKRYAEFLAAG